MEQAVERGASRSVQFCSRRADGGASKGAPSAEHFLADGNADAFLKFEAHQRNVTVERIRGGLRISLAKLSDHFDQHFGKGEPGHGAGSTGHQFFQEESAAQAPENAEINSFGRFQNADSLQRGGRVLEFDGARPGDLASDTHQQRRLHGETGNRGIILHDDFDVHRGSHGGEVGNTGFRIELEHARGAYHHAGAPAERAMEANSTQARTPSAVAPAITGTRPLTSAMTVSRTSARSRSFRRAASPVTPRAVRPLMLAER